MNVKSFDAIGNIAIVKFPEKTKIGDKKKIAKKILGENKGIRTILEKKEKIKGRLRKISTNFIEGENTKEALYRENNCVFRFNVDKTYFSPRLSNERKEIADKIKKNETVLVMFAGVAPYSVVIAKNSPAKKVFSNEINREANKYAEMNIKLNKLKEKIELVNGDIKKVAQKINQKFDVIVMPRPQLKDSFLKEAFFLSKKGTRIYYYDFCKIEDINLIVEKIKNEANKSKKKIKILNVKRAGEIAPYKTRLRVDFKII
ncbi:MAG: methyltransferase [Candidatus Pacearchaeota archaeon]|nr:methyltransferase [Candidatus Pacearchaeota archaeon]